jgi:hypothetical protein
LVALSLQSSAEFWSILLEAWTFPFRILVLTVIVS